MQLALGLIETKGLIGAIEAADAMLKAANVKLVSKEKVTGALMCIKIIGETAAVKAAVDAGAAAAQRVGELYAAHVIPRPDDQIDDFIFDTKPSKVKPEKSKKADTTKEVVKKPEEKQDDDSLFAPEKDEEHDDSDIAESEEWDEEKENEIEMSSEIPSAEGIEKLNVHQLRRLARAQENFPIKGRDISKANRQDLLEHFKSIR